MGRSRLPKNIPDKFYIRHVMKYIGCCRRTILNAEKDGRIPPARRDKNGYRIYTTEEVEKIAEKLLGSDYKRLLGPFPDVLYYLPKK